MDLYTAMLRLNQQSNIQASKEIRTREKTAWLALEGGRNWHNLYPHPQHRWALLANVKDANHLSLQVTHIGTVGTCTHTHIQRSQVVPLTVRVGGLARWSALW